jgi:predicted RNase H-like nuclease (RuvC/YqgF family)
MKKRTKEEMAEYQRNRRANVTPTVKNVTPALSEPVTPVTPLQNVTPGDAGVTPMMSIVKKVTAENDSLKKEVARLKAEIGRLKSEKSGKDSEADPEYLFRRVVAAKEARLRQGG